MTDSKRDVPYREEARRRQETLQALRNDVRSSLQQWRQEHSAQSRQDGANRQATLDDLRGQTNSLKRDTHTMLDRYRDDLSQSALAQDGVRRDFVRNLKITTSNDLSEVPKMLAVFRSDHQRSSMSDAAARRQALQTLFDHSESSRAQWQADRLERAKTAQRERLEGIRARRDDVNQNIRARPYRADTAAASPKTVQDTATVVTGTFGSDTSSSGITGSGLTRSGATDTNEAQTEATSGIVAPEVRNEPTFANNLPEIDTSMSLRDQVITYLERKPGTNLETILDDLDASEDDIFETLDELQTDGMIKVRNKGYYLSILRQRASDTAEVEDSEEDFA